MTRESAHVRPAATALNPSSVRQAVQWLVRLHSGEMSPSDHEACRQWRASDPDHEAAWLRAEQIGAKLRTVPSNIAASTLRQAAIMNRRKAIKALTLVMGGTPIAWGMYRWGPGREWMSDARTRTGERRELSLPDGSRLMLNTSSAINIQFDERVRRIALVSGEIWVETSPDPTHSARPFMVESQEGSIRALGTRFLVRQGESVSCVAVQAGAVEVTPRHNPGAAFIVPTGQQSHFTGSGGETPLPLSAHSGSWTQGTLYAEKMQLDEFLAEVGRYRPGVLRCDPAVAKFRVSGAFQLRDTDVILQALAASLPLRIHSHSRYWVTVVPA